MSDPKALAQAALKVLDLPLGVYRHYKGGEYVLFAVSLMEETLQIMVHYYSVGHGTRWTRALSNWNEQIDVHLDPARRSRFEYVRPFTYEEFQVALWR
jgi:hypothetical protein